MLHIFLLCTLLLFILHISFRIITCIIIVSIKYMIDIAIVFSLCTNNNSSTIYVEWCAICRNFLSLFFIFYYLHYHNNFELYLSHSNLRRVVSPPTRYFLIPNFFSIPSYSTRGMKKRTVQMLGCISGEKREREKKEQVREKISTAHWGKKCWCTPRTNSVGVYLPSLFLIHICSYSTQQQQQQ